MKKSAKIPPDESCSVSEAARLLGVSIPTAKRMVADGQLEAFRTPGGHLRIVAESIEALREQAQRPRPVREASLVLHNRRERLEELTIEAQELRAKRELEKLRREQAEEEEQRQAEAEARDLEAAEQREVALLEAADQREAARLEQRRFEREQQRELDRQEAEREQAEFHSRWLGVAAEALSASQARWFSAAERKEIMDALEAEIERRTPKDEPLMPAIVGRNLAALIESVTEARQAEKRRQNAAQCALWRLPAFVTDSEKAQASEAVRKALAALPDQAQDLELRAVAEEALRPIRERVQARQLAEQALKRRQSAAQVAFWRLSAFATDSEKAQASEALRNALAGLPDEAKDFELRAAADQAIQPICQTVEKRLLGERVITWAVRELPWHSDDRDKARVRRECAEILAELPADISEAEAKEALEPTIREACQEIEDRQARKRREQQKANLVQQGLAEISRHLWRLNQAGEIAAEEYLDSDFTAGLQRTVKAELERVLIGEESTKEVEETVHEIIDGELLG